MKKYIIALNAIQDRIARKVGKEPCLVEYSAYKNDKNDIPIDNLDEVPIQGPVQVYRSIDAWSETEWKSQVIESPTWLDLCVIANELIKRTGDKHHIFFEGYKAISKAGGVTVIELVMGS
jgi:hypothetical protein